MLEAIAAWRATALAIVTLRMPSTESQRRLAIRFLKQHRRLMFLEGAGG